MKIMKIEKRHLAEAHRVPEGSRSNRRRGIFLFLAMISLLFIFGCNEMFDTPQNELPLGYGLLTLNINGMDTQARAILPDNDEFINSIEKYRLSFTGTTPNITFDIFVDDFDEPIEVPSGSYNLLVEAYSDFINESDYKQVAVKPTSVDIPNGENVAINITLELITSGNGTFSWDITLPTLQEAYMTITPQDETNPLVLYFIGGSEQVTNPGTLELPAGDYFVEFTLIKNAESRTIVWPESLHVYCNLTSRFEKDFSGYTFGKAGFKVTLDFNYDDDNVIEEKYLFYGETVADEFNLTGDPVNGDFVFTGWYIAGTDTKWDINAPVNRDLDLIASWTESGTTIIYYWINQNTTLGTSTGETSISGTESVTINAIGGGFTEHKWYVNGIDTARGITYTFSAEGRQPGEYTITLSVYNDTRYYSADFVITVEE